MLGGSTPTFELLRQCIPDDHSRQISSEYYLQRFLTDSHRFERVLDLGCGAGNSVDYFRKMSPGIRWVGLDLEKSPEARARTRTDAEFRTFDGIRIPFESDEFDLVYCKQVLEHVRHPSALLKEVRRVLRSDGYFVGSTSHLEPYHSHSLWNYTPYGFRCLIEEAGLRLIEIRPGIDGLTLLLRRGLRVPRLFDPWFTHESPLNLAISLLSTLMRRSPSWSNAVKLLFCGHFCFLVGK